MIPIDFHMHSRFSKDGENSVIEMCEAAVRAGLSEVCFTEHLDFDREDSDYGYFDYAAYAGGIAEARRAFAGRLAVRMGIEFDFRRAYGDEPGRVLSGWDFDYRLGSVHSAMGLRIYRLPNERPTDFSLRDIQAEYMAEVEALIASGWCNAIGHFDYLYKQLPDLVRPYRDAWYWRQVERVLAMAIEKGVALEVNSHHILDRGQALAADTEILILYRAMGGRLLTVGSDAHRVSGIAHGHAEVEAAIRKAGFDAITAFEQGRPRQVPL